MVVKCIIKGCPSKWGLEKIGFFGVPSVIKTQGSKTEDLSQRRRRLWLACINRADSNSKTGRDWRVCSKHFIKGHPAQLYDDSNPDWLPSLNVPNKIQISTSADESEISTDCPSTSGENTLADEPTKRKSQGEDASDTRSKRPKRLRITRLLLSRTNPSSVTPVCDVKVTECSNSVVCVSADIESNRVQLRTGIQFEVKSEEPDESLDAVEDSDNPSVEVPSSVTKVSADKGDLEDECSAGLDYEPNVFEPSVLITEGTSPIVGYPSSESTESSDKAVSIVSPEVRSLSNKLVQTDLYGAQIERLKSQIKVLKSEVIMLQSENKVLTEKVDSLDRMNASLKSEITKIVLNLS